MTRTKHSEKFNPFSSVLRALSFVVMLTALTATPRASATALGNASAAVSQLSYNLVCNDTSCPISFFPPNPPVFNDFEGGYFYDSATPTSATLSWSATIPDFSETISCDVVACFYNWSGDFGVGSTISMDLQIYGPNGSFIRDVNFVGPAQGGFSGSWTAFKDGSGGGFSYDNFSFSGPATNGWEIVGSGSVSADTSEQVAFGSMQLDITQTPEPSSLTLLASGILGVAGLMRRRLSALW